MEKLHTAKTTAKARISANKELSSYGYTYDRASKTWCRGGAWGLNFEMAYVRSSVPGLAFIHIGQNPATK